MTKFDANWFAKEEARHVHGQDKGSIVGMLLLSSLLSASSVAAQEVNDVILDATYFGAPTEWCPENTGVPVIVNMDGPNIIKGPAEPLKAIITRKGNKIDRVSIGEFSSSMWSDAEVDQDLVGRFTAEFKTCQSLWSAVKVTGSWRLIGADGSDLGSGTYKDVLITSYSIPFFRHLKRPSSVHYAKFGDQFLYTATRPITMTTQAFAAEPDKE